MRKLLFVAPKAMQSDFEEIASLLLKRRIHLSFMPYSGAIDWEFAAENHDCVISTLHIDSEADSGRLIHPPPPLLKTVQYEKFSAAGLRTPFTAKFRFGMTLEGADDDLLVLKPDRLDTSEPDTVFFLRRKALSGMRFEDFANDHPIIRHRFVVQDFIPTGAHATSFRIYLFCGAPLLSYRIVARQAVPALDERHLHAGPEIVSNGPAGYDVELHDDPALLKMAREMSAALDHPVLCTLDILRDAREYWALEANVSYLNIWPPARADLLNTLGREAMIAQFDLLQEAADKIADIAGA